MIWSSLHLTGVGVWVGEKVGGEMQQGGVLWMQLRLDARPAMTLGSPVAPDSPPPSLPLAHLLPPCQAARTAGAQGASGGRGPRLQQRLHDWQRQHHCVHRLG